MISDVLNTAVTEINSYLKDETFSSVYRGALRDEIVAVQTIMNALRIKLDSLPLLLNNEVHGFITGRCEIAADARILFSDAYNCYKDFCKKSGFSATTRRCFAAQMRKALPDVEIKTCAGLTVCIGLTAK